MKKFLPLYKIALFTYLIDPLFYIASLVTVLFCVLRFFFVGHFFLAGVGTSDLRPFFTSLPYISILVVPLLVLRLRHFISDDSFPATPTLRFSALVTAAFSAFSFPLVLLVSLPLCVNLFGTVDAGQVCAGFVGVLLYGFTACAATVFLYAHFTESAAVPLFLSALLLSVVNVLHLLPLYVPAGNALTFLCRAISFSWHFDAAEKGIFDSRDLVFYALASILFILLSVRAEYKRIGRRINALTQFLLVVILLCSGIAFSRLYFRADLTQSRTFSLSQTSKTLVSQLEAPLRVTYYRSAELKNLYPQTNDVAEYLTTYCAQSRNLTLQFEKPDGDKLNALGIQGQQIRNDTGTKTEFVTVYSAVLLQYLDKQTLIPFVLATDTLEYDLTRRVQDLITEKQKKVLIVAGNGRSIESEYGYVSPWLNAMGFQTEIIPPSKIEEKTLSAEQGTELLVFGSSALTREESSGLEHAVFSGIPALIATSPYSVALEDDWRVTKNRRDTLIPVLNSWGFTFAPALVQDISNVPLMLQSADADALQYTVNYPPWISILPQESTMRGLSLFWSSPLVLYENTKPLLVTTTSAWIQNEEKSAGTFNSVAGERNTVTDEYGRASVFLTNAFTVPKSAKEAGAETAQFVVGAYNDGDMAGYYETGKTITPVAVIADQYVCHQSMTAFTASEKGADFRNYDFLSTTLLRLRGDTELAALLEKSAPNNTLYKITDADAFRTARNTTLFVLFALLPALIAVLSLVVKIRRRRYNAGYVYSER